jgi:UDP-GlcNAc:undecaprenyl-phosphate GlcNAc-1-phosphate transferase
MFAEGELLALADVAEVTVVSKSMVAHFLATGAGAFAAAAISSIVLTMLVRRLAPMVGLVDRPDAHRKLHNRVVPLGGGAAVFLSSALVVLGLMFIPNYFQDIVWAVRSECLVFLLAGAIIVVVGLIDDRIALRGRYKLLGQTVAASVLMAGGLVIHNIGIFGWEISLGWLAIPFTLFWLLGAINSVNLLDGIDGLATVLGFIMVGTIAAMGVLVGNMPVAILGLVFAGSLLGFLRLNLPPASVFLGDAGSMLIGMVVGALAIRGALKGAGTVLLAAPLAVWTIPILDSLAAILRRKLTGRSIYTTDRGHLHHRLLDMLGSNSKVLVWIGAFCAVTSAGTLLSVFLKSDMIALVVCSALVIILVATGVFGRAEWALLTTRFRHLGRALVERPEPQSRVRQETIRLQGNRPWELLWASLTESAEKFGLIQIRLDLNLPRQHEGYHAFWECPNAEKAKQCWRMEIPLTLADQSVGYLKLAGARNGHTVCEEIERIMTMLEPFETQLRTMVHDRVAAAGGNGELVAVGAADEGQIVLVDQAHPR